jgi:hypothetical protein
MATQIQASKLVSYNVLNQADMRSSKVVTYLVLNQADMRSSKVVTYLVLDPLAVGSPQSFLLVGMI